MGKKEIVIIGIGRFSIALIDKFKNISGYSIVAIDLDKEKLKKITGVKNLIVGDATDEEWLKSIGIENASFYVIGMGSDFQTSSIVAANLNENFSGTVIAKSVNQQHEMILHKMGIENVVTPEIAAAKRTFNRIVNPLALKSDEVYEMIEISHGVSIVKVPVINEWRDEYVRDISLPKGLGFALIFKKGIKASVVTGDTKLEYKDIAALVGEDKILLSFLEQVSKEI